MQKLHLVGFTADNDGLIFSTRKGAKSGSFVVPIDGRLLKEVAEAERRRDGGGAAKAEEHRLNSPRLVRPESALTPREMQDRIRSGWTLDEVAAEAGVDDDWVRRFAAPVLAEVRQVVERARAATYDKPRFGLSTLPLGASVRRNVLDRGVRVAEEELDDAWSAYQLDDDLWIVRFAYVSRGRLQEAEWFYDLETEELSSRNRLAGQLGHVLRGRARRAPAAVSTVPKPTKKPAPKTTAPKKTAPTKVAPTIDVAARKVAAQKVAAQKQAAQKVAAKKLAAKKSAAKKLAAKSTAARAVSSKRKAAPAKTPARRAPAPARPVKKAATPLRPAAVQRAAPARPAPSTRATSAGRAPAPPRKKTASQPAKKPAKERIPAREAVEVLPEHDTSAWAPPPRQQDWATDPGVPAWVAPESAPPPAAPLPDEVREAATAPIGDELDPPLPGATDVDPVSGIARIDSRRMSRYVSAPPPRQPVFRGDVARAGGQPQEPPGPRRPRRSEPLRGR